MTVKTWCKVDDGHDLIHVYKKPYGWRVEFKNNQETFEGFKSSIQARRFCDHHFPEIQGQWKSPYRAWHTPDEYFCLQRSYENPDLWRIRPALFLLASFRKGEKFYLELKMLSSKTHNTRQAALDVINSSEITQIIPFYWNGGVWTDKKNPCDSHESLPTQA